MLVNRMQLVGSAGRVGLVGLVVALGMTTLVGVAEAQREVAKAPAKAVEAESAAQTMMRTMPAKAVMDEMMQRERESTAHRNMYTYTSNERSERTGGRLWTEKVVEAQLGHVRKLLAIDGVALTAEQEAQERGRLAGILRNPSAFEKEEQERQKDELHARQMVQLLDRAFLFENMRVEGENVVIDFRPNPAYQPQSMEERIMHAMSGSVTVNPSAIRMRKITAELPTDVTIGFGLLATIHAGTRFQSERDAVETGEWKTRVIDSHIDGRALFFKTLSKNEHAVHEGFVRVPNDLTLAQAIELAERQ